MERPRHRSVEDAPSHGERLVRLRLMLMALSLCLWGLLILGRLFQLQLFEGDSFARQAARQSERTINLSPRRGPILDRKRRPLAVSVDAESVYAVPQEIRDATRTAAELARALGWDGAAQRELAAQLQRNRAFVWVKRKVDPQTVRALRGLQLEGIGFLAENRRYYPKRELASQVLGYVGTDNTGMSGIEYALEELIGGRAAKVTVHIDARRRPVGHTEKPSTEGMTVVLTLDEVIQYIAERELDSAMAETASLSGVVIVMDPTTGEILAMANSPTFNPNRWEAYSSARWRNRAVADAYEPGSVFKVFTAAAGLQEKVVDPDEVIDCGGGAVEVAGTVIHDHQVFKELAFRDVIGKSSDVGVIRVAQRLGRENFSRYVREFGFGVPTGVELPGESGGLLRPTSKWSALSLASLSFGQEVGVTALQLATAVSAVANGGTLMRPMIVRQVESASGEIVKVGAPAAVRRVLEEKTVDTLTDLLKGVVARGTGRRAAVPGYEVAGKTGTAQKIDATGRYSAVDHVASFVGFAPASRPALVILVSLDSPRGTSNQGGDVAAPLFARIAERALRHLAIAPDDSEGRLPARPPSAEGLLLASTPEVAAPHSAPSVLGATAMPDLRGRSAREAAIEAARRGLIVELKGSGWVVAQDPEAGSEIMPGMTCALRLGRSEVPSRAVGLP